MIEVTQTLCTWWDVMADMRAKYGTGSEDIEEKPEWGFLQEIQEEMLEELQTLTGASQDLLFECVQQAMFRVLGMYEETTLNPDQAQEIIRVAVQLALAYECRDLRARKLVN